MIAMPDEAIMKQDEKSPFEQRKTLRMILLLLAMITSPLICCGCIFLLNAMPNSPLPRLFEGKAQVENNSGETLYLTPITTTYGHPEVITQSAFFRQRDIPLEPNQSVVLTYDTADTPLAGIAVCRANQDCRLLGVKNYFSDTYHLESMDTLPKLDQDWLKAIQSHPRYNYGLVIFPALGLIPVALFWVWLYTGMQAKKLAARRLM